MNNVSNNVATVASKITAASGSFAYTDADSVDIGTAGATNGITTNGGNVTVTSVAGNVGLSQNVSTGGTAAGTVTLNASGNGAVTETTGSVTANGLLVLARNDSLLAF